METPEGPKDVQMQQQPKPIVEQSPVQSASQPKSQPEGPSRWTRLTSFYYQCTRVFKLTRKPTNEEYKTIVKVCAIGMAFLGAIGFVISVINQFIMF